MFFPSQAPLFLSTVWENTSRIILFSHSFMPRKKKLFTKEHPEQPTKLAAIVEISFWNHRHPHLKHEEKLAIHLSDHSFVGKNQGCCTSNCRRVEIPVPKLRKWRDRGLKQYFRKKRYLGKKWLVEFLRFWEKCRGIKWYKIIFPNSLLVLDAQMPYLKHDSKRITNAATAKRQHHINCLLPPFNFVSSSIFDASEMLYTDE